MTIRKCRGAVLWTLTSLACFVSLPSAAQQLVLPRASPRAQVTQTVGVSTITIDFGRPGVKGRLVWGNRGLVPYNGGDPLPWRTGADEPTTIEFSHEVEIEGQPLAAGIYGLFTIPDEREWIVILSRNTTDAFSYDPDQDVVRVSVEAESAPHEERLDFEFEALDDPSLVTIALRWERKRVPFVARFDLPDIVLEEARTLLSTSPEGWVPWFQAANFSLENDGDVEEALGWIEESIRRSETRANLSTKAGLLEESGRPEEAAAVRDQMKAYSRESWQRVDDIFGRLGVTTGSWIADVGAGDGYLTTRLSEAVGASGQVFAVDVDERALDRLHRTIDEDGLSNVTVLRGSTTTPRLPPHALDGVVIVNAYHKMTEYPAMHEGTRRSLKPGGRLVLVEPMSESSRGGSRADQVRNHDLAIDLARGELEDAGFEVLEQRDPFVEMPGGGTQWLLVAAKPDP